MAEPPHTPKAAAPTVTEPDTEATEIQADTPPGAANAPERRRHSRVTLTTKVLIFELDDTGTPGTGQPGECMDISRSGLGLRARRMYYAGKKIIVMLNLPNISPKFMCGTVRSSRYTSGGHYHIGVELCSMPTGKQVAMWMQSVQQQG